MLRVSLLLLLLVAAALAHSRHLLFFAPPPLVALQHVLLFQLQARLSWMLQWLPR